MEAKKARGDIILYAVLAVAGIVFYKWIIPTQIFISKTASAEAFSPDTFPNAVTLLFIAASLAGLLLAVFRYRKAVQAEGKPQRDTTPKTRREIVGIFIPFIVFALVLAYAIMFKYVGFIPATVIIPPVILFVIGCRKWYYYPIYYAFAAAMYLLFRYILLVPIR